MPLYAGALRHVPPYKERKEYSWHSETMMHFEIMNSKMLLFLQSILQSL